MRPRLLALLLACGIAAGVADAAPVRVRVLDDASGQIVAARAYLSRGAEAVLPPGLPSYDKGDERHVLIAGDVTFDLAPGTYKLRVERGLEYLPVELEFSVPQIAPVDVRLRRWIDMNRTGWFSADMHVHRDPADIPLILRAEDLNFVPTVTTHVWSTEVSQPWKIPAEFPVTVEPNRFFTGNSQEIERIQGGPGAVILLGRDVPLPFTGYELYPPSIRTPARSTMREASSRATSCSGWIPTSTRSWDRSTSSSSTATTSCPGRWTRTSRRGRTGPWSSAIAAPRALPRG